MSTTETIATVGVVGDGTMGTAIAGFLNDAGIQIISLGPDGDANALADVDLVMEAVPERTDVKQAALAEIAEAVGPDVLVTSATSALSITELAGAVSEPGRFCGLVFHLPVAETLTIEIAPGLLTDPQTTTRLSEWVNTLPGKQALVVEDRPGFLLNSMLMPYLNDVIAAYDDDLASAEDLDIALQLGLGYRTGPMQMLDRIGLDTHLDATAAAFESTGDARYAPPALLRRMVAAGFLGDKTEQGFTTRKDDSA